MKNLIRYDLEAYDRNELTLSAKAKKSILDYAESAQEQYGPCKEILVCGKWQEPFSSIDSKDYVTTWRFYVTFEKTVQEVHVNRKAIW
jgi:protein-arginine kinase activator protein McsA